MDVVDIHAHLMDEHSLPPEWHDRKVDLFVREAQLRGERLDTDQVRAEYVEAMSDPTGERLLERMDDAGIDHQVVFPVDWGVPHSDPEIGIRAFNRRIREFQAANPDRITAFATIDPRREGAVSFIDRALEEWAAGVKIHPATGFYPHDEEAYELFEVAADHDVPVLVHQGPISAPLYSEYAHPNYLDTVVSDFPELDIIAAHMAIQWWEELLSVAEVNANTGLRVDISYWQERFVERPEKSARVLRRFIDTLGADRVHFGTDYPVFWTRCPASEWTEIVRSLADRATEPTFTDREIELVMGGGARQLLDL